MTATCRPGYSRPKRKSQWAIYKPGIVALICWHAEEPPLKVQGSEWERVCVWERVSAGKVQGSTCACMARGKDLLGWGAIALPAPLKCSWTIDPWVCKYGQEAHGGCACVLVMYMSQNNQSTLKQFCKVLQVLLDSIVIKPGLHGMTLFLNDGVKKNSYLLF